MTEGSTSAFEGHPWRAAFRTMGRLLIFRASQDELAQPGWPHLAVGLCCTLIVGIGRYWDNPRVGLVQALGLGSLVYVFVLALFLWLIIWPLRPRYWSYFRVLTFITLVSPPAILYAIPVQMVYGLDTANAINAWFLAIVASWRVALLFFFLRRLGEIGWLAITTATLLPLSFIVVGLTILNLDQVVFDMMSGIVDKSPNDTSYAVLITLSWLSILLFIPLVILYLAMIASRFWAFRDEDAGLMKDDKNNR